MNPLDNVTALWAFVSIVVALVALALGWLLGHGEGLAEGFRIRREEDSDG